MPPETRYAKGPHGLIAYQVVGDGPLDLVYLSGATSHIDIRWESARSARFLERLASFSRLIAFDRRGIGASDPIPFDAPPSWEQWAEDLVIVMDAVESEQAAIFALLDGAAIAIPFAASHPERTTALILGNSTARLIEDDDYPEGISKESANALKGLIAQGWGTEDFAAMTSPSLADDERERKWFAKFMRGGASPHVAEMQLGSTIELDLRAILPSIRVPTLVLHRRGFKMIPIEQGRYLADHIADAKFVELEGMDSSLAQGDGQQVLDAVEEFLTGVRRDVEPGRVLATILVTDLVRSTERLAHVGDRNWKQMMDRHDEVADREIHDHLGRLWKRTGDGILATFDSPGRGIRCARAISAALDKLDMPMRAGLHTGEIELRGQDIGGIAVHIAERVASMAGAGEVFVSRTVTDLVTGSGFSFDEVGQGELKGVPGRWPLFRLNSRSVPN